MAKLSTYLTGGQAGNLTDPAAMQRKMRKENSIFFIFFFRLLEFNQGQNVGQYCVQITIERTVK